MSSKVVIFTAIVIIFILVGGVFLINNSYTQEDHRLDDGSQSIAAIETDSDSMYQGKVLAGNTATYREFTQADYEKAQAEGKIIFLDFYADWCPICRGEEPAILEGFNSLETDKVIGFRVNYKDSQTDDDEKRLAQQLEIPYQHHKVIIKNGQVVLKNGEVWDKDRVATEINSVL